MTPNPDILIKDPALAIAFGLGAGLAPKIPGTVGTLLAIPLWWMFSGLGLLPYLVLTMLAFVFGVWVCERAMSILGEHDHRGIVFDEIVGYFAALAFVPAGPWWVLLSFVLFRLFDILKPWPISWLDRRVPGGFGVMVDDLAAGACTAIVILLVSRW